MSGLVTLTRVAFSAASTVSVDNVCDSTYDYYHVTLEAVNDSTNQGIGIRYRASGTDATGATDYVRQRLSFNDTSESAAALTASSLTIGNLGTTVGSYADFDIANIALASSTFLVSRTFNTQGGARQDFFTGVHKQSTAYDGFTVFPVSGTMTGVMTVYGYAKS